MASLCLFRRVAAFMAATIWLWGAAGVAAAGRIAVDGEKTLLTICTAYGLQKITIDADGQVVDSAPADESRELGHDCPCTLGCGGLFAAALDGLPAPFPSVFVVVAVVLPAGAAASPPPARGPPLGPRAPPINSWMI